MSRMLLDNLNILFHTINEFNGTEFSKKILEIDK